MLIINKRTRKQKILRLCMAREPRCMFWLLSWPVSTSVAKVTLNLNYCIVYKNKNTPLYSIRWHRVTIIIIIFLFYLYVKIIITHQKYRTIPWTTRQLEENGVWTLPTSGHLWNIHLAPIGSRQRTGAVYEACKALWSVCSFLHELSTSVDFSTGIHQLVVFTSDFFRQILWVLRWKSCAASIVTTPVEGTRIFSILLKFIRHLLRKQTRKVKNMNKTSFWEKTLS